MSSHPACFHCGEPVTTGRRYLVRIRDSEQPVCCPGCKAVAEFIQQSGLARYYEFRTAPALKPDRPEPATIRPEWRAFDREALQKRLTAELQDGKREATLLVEGVRCAACSWLIERSLADLTGIDEVHVNPATARARVVWHPETVPFSRVLDDIARLGYRPHPMQPGAAASIAQRERRKALKRLLVAALGMMQVMTYAVSLYAGAFQGMDPQIREFLRLVSLLVATPVVLYSGFPFFAGAWRDLSARRPGMDVPVALAIGAAYVASIANSVTGSGEVYFDSVTMFVFFLSLGRFAEMAARHRAGEVADALARMAPSTALRIVPGDTQALPVGVAELEPGDRVLVRGGDAFPADGKLATGPAHVDESMLTGESHPVHRVAGESVVGGSLNIGDPVEMAVERTGADTTLSHISRLLERAQAARPGLARAADRVAGWFVSAVLLIAAGVALWWAYHAPESAFAITLSVLVVTCPCALSLATPTALTAATSRLAAHGLLVTRGDALETLARVDRLVLDKTGTLTEGHITLADARATGDLDIERCLEIAAALEAGSEHPIASAFSRPGVTRAAAIRTLPGEGVEGRVDDRLFRIGSPSFVGAIAEGGYARQAELADASVVLGNRDGCLAAFELADALKPDTVESLEKIRSRQVSLEIASGDRPDVVESIARETGINIAHGRMTPEAKLRLIRDHQASGNNVAMVGDGVNDAPVLAGANVSIAMGAGAPLAHSSADMILLGESLAPLAEGIDTARKALRVIRQNLAWAASYNLVALPLAAAGLVTPWMAAIGMSLSSLAVVLNSGRLAGRRRADPRTLMHQRHGAFATRRLSAEEGRT